MTLFMKSEDTFGTKVEDVDSDEVIKQQEENERIIRMINLETEGQKFNIVFKHDMNRIPHPNPKQNKDGTIIDPYTKKDKNIVRGGTTTCSLTKLTSLGDVESYYEGEAICNERDMYNRAIGREIAFGRAVKKYQQEQLTEITNWIQEQYVDINGASPGVDKQVLRKKIMAEATEAMNNISRICNQLKKTFKNRKKK